MKRSLFVLLVLPVALALVGCATMPPAATVVDKFEIAKYVGKWYEIARLDFFFEKDLDSTTAEYALRDNGTVAVTNRGYNVKTGAWQESQGTARFRGDTSLGALEVAFFGPFFAAYNVISLDGDYQYALIAGGDTRYLWILSRTKDIPSDIREKYLQIARSLGYVTDNLLWVNQR